MPLASPSTPPDLHPGLAVPAVSPVPAPLTLTAPPTLAGHLARPTGGPVPSSSTKHVDALFHPPSWLEDADDSSRWQPIGVHPDDLRAPDPNDFSTLHLLEHLHPNDLQSLAESLASHPSAPPRAVPSNPWSRPPLLRVQDMPRRRSKRSSPNQRRLQQRQAQGDGSGPSAEGYPVCTTVSNAVLSCYPLSNTTLVQNIWSKFIWNNNYPTFIGSTYVDIYLYNANSETIASNWTGIENDRGMIGIEPQDSWFPPLTSWTDGQNVSVPYFFVITTHGAELTGGEQHQATFTALQTAPPTSLLLASLSSASVDAAAILTSARFSPTSQSSSSSSTSSNNGDSALQGDHSNGSFPHWAIALLVILSLLAFFAFLVACYFICLSARRKRHIRAWRSNTSPGSIGSRSPMIQAEGAALMAHSKRGSGHRSATGAGDIQSPGSSRPGSPFSAADPAAAFVPAAAAAAAIGGAASSNGNRESTVTADSHDGPITEADAHRMAEAFRKALRKPEFPSGDPSPGSSNETDKVDPTSDANASVGESRLRNSMMAQVVDNASPGQEQDDEGPEAEEIMSRELASEGKSMTSVDNRRTPEVHAV